MQSTLYKISDSHKNNTAWTQKWRTSYAPVHVCLVFREGSRPAWVGFSVPTEVLDLHDRGGGVIFPTGYSTCMTWGALFPWVYSICMAGGYCSYRGINLHERGSMFPRGFHPAWPEIIFPTGLLNLHERQSLFLRGSSSCKTWDGISARMAKNATVP